MTREEAQGLQEELLTLFRDRDLNVGIGLTKMKIVGNDEFGVAIRSQDLLVDALNIETLKVLV